MDNKIKTFSFKKGFQVELEVKDITVIRQLPLIYARPHKTTFYQIIWLEEGEMLFYIDFREIRIRAGEMLVVCVNQILQYDLTGHYRGKIILFTHTFFNQAVDDNYFLQTAEILNPSNLNRVSKLNVENMNMIISLLCCEIKKTADEFHLQIILNYLRIILLEGERDILQKIPKTQSPNRNVARSFFNEVDKQFRENKQVDYYLQLLNVGEKVLSKNVKIQTNRTPKQYIEDRIILEAKRLLIYSNYNIKEIAFELGFDEPTNFSKFFKKQTKISPNNFKELEMQWRSI